MANVIKIKRGLDIPIEGAAPQDGSFDVTSSTLYGIVPDDFPGVKWKTAVAPGDKVLQGAPLLYNKECEAMKLISPVSGTVREVRRGERRHIMAVTVEKEKSNDEKASFDLAPYKEAKDKEGRRAALRELLYASGLWAMMRQRPYDIVPDTAVEAPRDIFVTAFDTAPLAPGLTDTFMRSNLERGLEALAEMTDGKVYLSVRYDSPLTSKVAVVTEFDGPHPAGNVGVQINHLAPVNRGETVWTLDSRTAVRLGSLLETGVADVEAEVALTGPGLKNPHMIHTEIGTSISDILSCDNSTQCEHVRVISGNILTGVQVDPRTGFLRYPYRQVTVLPEGDDADEFMGWASLSPKKFSVKHSFPSFLFPKSHHYDYDARLRGGRRAMILSGEYDKVFPMDILPEYLLRAIEAKDIDKMEQLGIYEVAPEDFALPEFVDTSKQPLQQIVRQGLDYLRDNA